MKLMMTCGLSIYDVNTRKKVCGFCYKKILLRFLCTCKFIIHCICRYVTMSFSQILKLVVSGKGNRQTLSIIFIPDIELMAKLQRSITGLGVGGGGVMYAYS